MKKTYIPRHETIENERINAGAAEMRAQRQRVQRQRKHTVVPWVLTGIFAFAALGGAAALGINMMNNVNTKATTVQPTAAAKLSERQNSNNQPSASQTKSSNAVSTQNTYSQSSNAWSKPTTVQQTTQAPAQQAVQQTTAKGTHHSGANSGSGVALHVFANGKTAKGYDWRYEGGSGLVKVGCDYTFASNTYDFSLIGVKPGSGTITIFYHTDDNTQAPLTVAFTVDSNLNVSFS